MNIEFIRVCRNYLVDPHFDLPANLASILNP
jgi:hypothetical protein